MNDTATAAARGSVVIDAAVLRTARQDAGFSQAELAKLVGITRSYVSMLEGGTRPTTAAGTFRKLCDVLHLRPTQLRTMAANSGSKAA